MRRNITVHRINSLLSGRFPGSLYSTLAKEPGSSGTRLSGPRVAGQLLSPFFLRHTPSYIPSTSLKPFIYRYEVGFMRKPVNNAHQNLDPDALNPDGTPMVRVRLPKKWNKEQFAQADLMLGAYHIRVRCSDGITRMGRIKGKMKKRVWIREGDTLIVTPWSFQDEKCDIIYRYLKPQTDWLRRNRYIT
jgi:translation initiation factor 1A